MKRFFSIILALALALSSLLTTFAAPAVLFGLVVGWVENELSGLFDSSADDFLNSSGEFFDAERDRKLVILRNFKNNHDIDRSTMQTIIEDFSYNWFEYDTVDTSSMVEKYGDNWADAWIILYKPLSDLRFVHGLSVDDILNFLYGSDKTDYNIDDKGNLQIPSGDFKDLVDDRKKDLKFYPTGNTGKASIKTDITYSAADYDSVRTADYFTFLANKTFFGFDGLSECYVVPFVESEGMEYFSNYCYKLELDIVRNDGHGNSAITALRIKKVDMDSFDTSSDYDSYSAAFDLEENLYKSTNSNTFYGEPVLNVFQSNPYGTFRFSSNMGLIIALSGLSDYYSHANGRYSLQYWDLDFFKPNFRSSDLVLGTTISASSIARTSTDFKHPVGELTKDFGFFVSTSPIQMLGFAADIDTQKIPDNYYITVEGDTIYDYTITDPATGQGDTINNYVTNNYTFVTDPGGESSGGSVDGNVTVGGQIDVSGSVDVGVDVNVNINGGAGGTGSLPDVNVDTNPLDNYLNSAIEDSSGIRQFFGSFFDFVPPEILVLLGIGLTFVIMGRILGR